MLPAGPGRGAADRALLTWATVATARGTAAFVVVSHDKAFAALPRLYTLITTGPTPAARLLRQRALVVKHVPAAG